MQRINASRLAISPPAGIKFHVINKVGSANSKQKSKNNMPLDYRFLPSVDIKFHLMSTSGTEKIKNKQSKNTMDAPGSRISYNQLIIQHIIA